MLLLLISFRVTLTLILATNTNKAKTFKKVARLMSYSHSSHSIKSEDRGEWSLITGQLYRMASLNNSTAVLEDRMKVEKEVEYWDLGPGRRIGIVQLSLHDSFAPTVILVNTYIFELKLTFPYYSLPTHTRLPSADHSLHPWIFCSHDAKKNPSFGTVCGGKRVFKFALRPRMCGLVFWPTNDHRV